MESLLEKAKSFLNSGLALLYPEWCQLCDAARATASESFICADCKADVRFIEPPFCSRCGLPFEGALTRAFECSDCLASPWEFEFARSAVIARDKMLEVIHRYKYQRALWFEPFLAELLTRKAQPEIQRGQWDWIVPVPLHPKKHREREFNQAERLGKRLSEATQIQLNTKLLRRTSATQSQTRLTREERLANVRKAFAFTGTQTLQGERLVLVDDVFTTGATTGACARILRAAGAGAVCVWTVARGV